MAAAPPVVMITGHGDIAMAVRCLKAGAFDFAEKPFDDDVLLAYVAKAVETDAAWCGRRGTCAAGSRLCSPGEDGRFGMIGRSRAMQEVYAQVEAAARSDAPVLVLGETGVGKELVARAIHAQSRRSHGPFVPVNAGALPETMLESELFGHAGALSRGRWESGRASSSSASGGTLLLDEIETISPRAQVQLLRVLDDGVVEAAGQRQAAQGGHPARVRLQRGASEEVRAGAIREDFYHRIMVLSIRVPPLRERAEDIPLLVSHFLQAGRGQERRSRSRGAGGDACRDGALPLARERAGAEERRGAAWSSPPATGRREASLPI